MPPPDYHAMLNELRAIGTNMNQIAQKAHVLNVIDTQRYEAAYTALKQALVEIIKAVTQPRKIERKNTGPPQSAKALRGEEQPRSGEPLDACGESDKRGEL
jgi:hemoglobin-like flavoprotein